MNTRSQSCRRMFFVGLLLTALLTLVWPMPGTIAVRHGALLLLLLLVLGSLITTRHIRSEIYPPKLPVAIFIGLTGWICLAIIFWAQEPALSWREFVPQWVVPMLVAFVGWGLVRWSFICSKQQLLIKTVFLALFASVVIQDLMGALYLWETGGQPFRQASILYIPRLLGGMPWQDAFDGNFGEKFSFVNNMFVAFVLAEIGQRLLTKQRWLQVSNGLLGFSLGAAVLCSYWLSFRNGNIGLLALLGFFGVLLIFAHRGRLRLWQKLPLVFLLAAGLAGLGYAFVQSDPRWHKFQETAAIAIEGDPGKAWLTHKDYPLLANGQVVDASAYERISWIKEGLKLSLKYPLGTGFNRSAFFDTLDRDHHMNGQIRGGHAHSGIIDFLVANGIPGAVLWVGFLASCVWVGWAMVRQGRVAQGLTVVFLVTGFFNRGLVDSNIRDHVLQQFLFLLTIYLTLNLLPEACANTGGVNHEPTA